MITIIILWVLMLVFLALFTRSSKPEA